MYWRDTSVKTCNICGETKAFSEFNKRKQSKDGHQSRCKVCQKELKAKWYQENKEHADEYRAKWYRENKEHVKEYYAKYAKANKGAVNGYKAKRRAAKLQATLAWADLQYIKDLYSNAAEANALFEAVGVSPKFQVDHIVPLQHGLVCGLHTEDNLQILTAEENLKKSNKFEVG